MTRWYERAAELPPEDVLAELGMVAKMMIDGRLYVRSTSATGRPTRAKPPGTPSSGPDVQVHYLAGPAHMKFYF